MKEYINDYIISGKTNELFAHIEVSKSDNEFEYSGKIIEGKFPESLILAIKEFHNSINDMAFSMLDKIEDKIYFYDLQLKKTNARVHYISINGNEISFFLKYPSGKGFLDSRP